VSQLSCFGEKLYLVNERKYEGLDYRWGGFSRVALS